MSSNADSLNSVRKKVTHTQELITTSHHEAGHVIYALLHFMMVYSTKVFPTKRSKRIIGFTHFYPLVELPDMTDSEVLSERLNTEISFYYAGPVAEKYQFKLHSGSDRLPFFLSGGSKDVKDAHDLIKKYQIVPSGDKRYNYKKKMIRRVNRELQQYWNDVTIVAHALYRKRRLSFDDLRSLLIKNSENKDFWKERFKIIYDLEIKSPLDEKELKSILLI